MAWIALTLIAFALGVVLQARVRSPLANPTLVATLIVAAVLLVGGIPHADYLKEVQPLTALLAPAIVALAVPMYRLRALLARQWRSLVIGGLSGTLVGVGADVLFSRVLGLGTRPGARC